MTEHSDFPHWAAWLIGLSVLAGLGAWALTKLGGSFDAEIGVDSEEFQ